MPKITRCIECKLGLNQIKQMYEKRLNSLADTFLTLLNNFQNNSLFRDFQRVQLLDNNKLQIQKIKLKVYTFRMEFLKSVIEGVIKENQQNAIKVLQKENIYLRSQNEYFHQIISFNQIQQGNLEYDTMDQHQILNRNDGCHSQYDDQQNCISIYSKIKPTQSKLIQAKNSNIQKQMHRNKYFPKNSSQSIQYSSQQSKGYETPQSTSFVVNLKENGIQDLSNNCISSIHPGSECSSFPNSQKRQFLQKQNQKQKFQTFTVSLREQLSTLNSNTKQQFVKTNSDSKRKKYLRKCLNDEENEQNIEPIQYQFKYLKF